MSKNKLHGFILITFMLSGCTFGHPPMMDKAQVLQQGDLPCFTVRNTYKTRKQSPLLRGINVYTSSGDGYSAGPQKLIWSVNYTVKPPLPSISPDQCISYGGSPSELETNRLYSVVLNTENEQKALPYEGLFCLVIDTNGVRQIEQVERYDYEVCKTTAN